MLLSSLVLFSGVALQPVPGVCCDAPLPRSISPGTSHPLLASPTPWRKGVDDSRRANFGGRVWQGAGEVGGMFVDEHTAATNPGPSAYGANEGDDSVVHVRLSSGYIVTISPWQAIDPSELSLDQLDAATRDWFRQNGTKNKDVWIELEEGRQQWLRERGYTYSVREFVGAGASDEQASADAPKPVMTIERPTDQPRFQKRMQVRSGEHTPAPSPAVAKAILTPDARISAPPLAGLTSRQADAQPAQPSQAVKPARSVEPKTPDAPAKSVAAR